MRDADGLENAQRHGAAFIASAQRPDGSFFSYSSAVRQPFSNDKSYRTVFTPALILGALNQLPPTLLRPERQQLASWLLAQKSPHWSFNYWARGEPVKAALAYPDDLDDTFCALIALHGYDPKIIDQSCLGKVVRLLVATETTVGGPYRTWLITKDAPTVWQDVDLAVNANIACFLTLVAEPLPNLNKLFEEAIAAGTFASPYYPSAFPLLYYLARAYRGPEVPTLTACILKQRKHGAVDWESPLQNALMISALTQLGKSNECRAAIQSLLQSQAADGSWPAEAFCLDPAQDGKPFYSGSAALTTAFALEAIARYESYQPAAAKRRASSSAKTPAAHKSIMRAARKEMGALDPALKQPALNVLTLIENRDAHHEITLLPSLFAKAHRNQPTEKPLCTELGLANLYGWAAYTLYDDLLDNEGEAQTLPVANVMLRYSMLHFERALPHNGPFQQLVRNTFDKIDAANAWEVSACRLTITKDTIILKTLPDFGDLTRLAERSLGHALAPLGILAAHGTPPGSPSARLLLSAFTHYLIARQLNDDLHDWEQDLRAGIATYVTSTILEELDIGTGPHKLRVLIPTMQRQFWHRTLPRLCDIAAAHTAAARADAAQIPDLQKNNVLSQLLDGIDRTIQRTLVEQSKAEDFLAAYKS